MRYKIGETYYACEDGKIIECVLEDIDYDYYPYNQDRYVFSNNGSDKHLYTTKKEAIQNAHKNLLKRLHEIQIESANIDIELFQLNVLYDNIIFEENNNEQKST